VRFAVRQRERRPVLAVTLVLTPGIGTGATTSFFAVVGAWVSDGLLRSLGATAVQGRLFEPAEHVPGGPAAAVVSEGFRARQFSLVPAARAAVWSIDRDVPLDGAGPVDALVRSSM